jgi:hypothetical protein
MPWRHHVADAPILRARRRSRATAAVRAGPPQSGRARAGRQLPRRLGDARAGAPRPGDARGRDLAIGTRVALGTLLGHRPQRADASARALRRAAGPVADRAGARPRHALRRPSQPALALVARRSHPRPTRLRLFARLSVDAGLDRRYSRPTVARRDRGAGPRGLRDARPDAWRLHRSRFAAAIPGAELIPLPAVGHVPMLDDPELVTQTILDFTAHTQTPRRRTAIRA